MTVNKKKIVPFAQQQLMQAISELKQGGSREEVLPMLEVVLVSAPVVTPVPPARPTAVAPLADVTVIAPTASA